MKDMKDYNAAFRKVYEFMEKHLNADSDDDWARLREDIKAIADPFEIGLAAAVWAEIERAYKGER